MKMLDKLKNYAKHYENEVRDISNQLRDEMMPELSRELFDEYEITGNRLRYEEGYFKRREFLSTFGLASVIWHKKEDIEKRDRLLKSGSLNDPIFDFADRFRRANYIVISAPYWDLSFPSLLKVFFEHICVCGITFAYDENGVEKGLCRCKELTYITTCGGYLGNYNLGYTYIKGLCGLFGIESTTEYALEGLDVEEKEVSLENCRVMK